MILCAQISQNKSVLASFNCRNISPDVAKMTFESKARDLITLWRRKAQTKFVGLCQQEEADSFVAEQSPARYHKTEPTFRSQRG